MASWHCPTCNATVNADAKPAARDRYCTQCSKAFAPKKPPRQRSRKSKKSK